MRSTFMIIEHIDFERLRSFEGISTLNTLEVGDSVFISDLKKAQSMRALTYYLIKSRNLSWKFTFRKMDRGWRVIRIK